MVKKVFSVLLIFVMMFSCTTAFAISEDESNERTELFNEVMESRANDPEFQRHYAEDPESAIAMINTIVDNKLTVNVESGDNINAWVPNAPLLMQSEDYYCGPASALQTILGYGGSVQGSTYAAKQDTLAGQMQSSPDTGTYVYRLSNTLNSYVSGYSYVLGSSLTDSQFKTILTNSIRNNKCAILHARTGYISYYEGNNYGHYICVSAVNNSTDMIQLRDCINVSRFYGQRSIPRYEGLDAISAASRYLISTAINQ